jgi:crossover junction endodeoxyribonuclease RusA
VPAARPRFARGRTYYPPKYNKWKGDAARILPAIVENAGILVPLECPVILDMTFVMPVTKGEGKMVKADIDNLSKAVMDALNGIAWVDDEQVVSLSAIKCIPLNGTEPRILCRIEPR